MRRLVLLLAFQLGACDQSVPPREANDVIFSQSKSSAAPVKQSVAPAAPTPKPSDPAPSESAKLALDAEGLRLVDPMSGRTTPLAFGMDESQILALLERTRGAVARGTNGECGAGPLGTANWADGLSLLMKKGRFVGWAVDQRSAGALSTMAGIGAGTSRKDLNDAYSAAFTKTTLGTEFQAGAIGGLLNGPRPDAKITNLWAGTTCLFR